MKNLLTYSILFFLVFCSNKGQAQRTLNFPKVVEYVEKMPSPDSLWIFIMAGQSNMAGRGLVEPQDTIANKRILAIDSLGHWMYAKEPLNFNEPTMKGLDSGLSFANELLGAIPSGISIGLIPSAVGNTSIEQWLGDSISRKVPLLTNFKSKVEQSKKYGEIKGVLWHQGEANAKTELIPYYAENLRKLTKMFRDITGNDALPILMGQLGAYAEPMEWQHKWDAINNIIDEVAETDKNTYVVYTQDLKSNSDKIHFNSESQRKLGKRYADTYLEEVMAIAKK
ncbi:sialate O-acetylesterase [Mariniflexile sp.]|uniref:sialate O-acetylesterase n=1 Tax=Mariniflexile sp. TaxID=1979402 RepID=UPI004048D43C